MGMSKGNQAETLAPPRALWLEWPQVVLHQAQVASSTTYRPVTRCGCLGRSGHWGSRGGTWRR